METVKVSPTITFISRTSPCKPISKRQKKDTELLIERMRKNKDKMEKVKKTLQHMLKENYMRKTLVEIAKILSRMTNIPLDRIAKRVNDATLCWYCENWDRLFPLLEMSFSNASKEIPTITKRIKFPLPNDPLFYQNGYTDIPCARSPIQLPNTRVHLLF